MRTTVNLRQEALELCKQRAEELKVPLGEVISEAVLATYSERPAQRRKTDYELPRSGEGGLQPGVDLDNRAALEDRLEGRA